jgi:hypothetical protein
LAEELEESMVSVSSEGVEVTSVTAQVGEGGDGVVVVESGDEVKWWRGSMVAAKAVALPVAGSAPL